MVWTRIQRKGHAPRWHGRGISICLGWVGIRLALELGASGGVERETTPFEGGEKRKTYSASLLVGGARGVVEGADNWEGGMAVDVREYR